MAMVRQLSPNSIASRSPSRAPHREPQTTCGQKTLILYTASGYIDQKTKKFVRKGRNACLEELKKKHGVKISGSTLDRIVLKGKEAKGGIVCLERKKYDRGKKSHLTEEVKEDYHHNSNELPRPPSPNHGDVACWDASVSILLDIGGARLIRDFGGIINT